MGRQPFKVALFYDSGLPVCYAGKVVNKLVKNGKKPINLRV